jgi:hypothetical protein
MSIRLIVLVAGSAAVLLASGATISKDAAAVPCATTGQQANQELAGSKMPARALASAAWGASAGWGSSARWKGGAAWGSRAEWDVSAAWGSCAA